MKNQFACPQLLCRILNVKLCFTSLILVLVLIVVGRFLGLTLLPSFSLANFYGRSLVAQENWAIKSFIGQFYHLQLRLRKISASFSNTQQQNADCKMILALFFLHLMNENKYYRVINKINN